ncbi:MAG: hypothetical protein M1834_000365 [Cirrosporium novae-zelandiae]|nr:MAG: hypothetical protein M1834_000365 [Cirrosporium novae-zelandiae]
MALSRACCRLRVASEAPEVTEELDERLRRRVGQMLVVSFDDHISSESIQTLIKDYFIGGIVLTSNNIKDSEQTANLTNALQNIAKDADYEQPLLIGLDLGEDNFSTLLGKLEVTQFPASQALAAASDSKLTQEVTEALAKELVALGINWLLGPSMEMVKDDTPPLLTPGKFGDNIQTIHDQLLASLRGLEAGRIIATAKYLHCPSEIESHDQALLAQRTLSQPEVKSILQTASTNEKLLDGPLIGQRLVHDHLRRELGFQGLTINDCSKVQPNEFRCQVHSAIYAMQMNADLVYLDKSPAELENTIEAIYRALQVDQLPPEVINAAVSGIELLKSNNLSWITALATPDLSHLRDLKSAHTPLVERAFRKSTALVRSNIHTLSTLPDLDPSSFVVLLTPIVPLLDPSQNLDPFEPLGRALARRHNKLRHVPYDFTLGITSVHATFLSRAAAVIFVACTTQTTQHDSQLRALRTVRDICRHKIPVVTIGACDPRDLLGQVQLADTYLCTFEYTPPALKAAVEVIFGEREAGGVVPVRSGGTSRSSGSPYQS